jgi:hypothetical protein
MAITNNPLDWANRVYGTPTASTMPAKPNNPSMTDPNLYSNLYNNQRNMPTSGSQAGSSDWLANYALQNNQASMAGSSPVSFNPLLGPEGVVNPNATLTGPGKTLTQVENEAYSQYLSSAMQQRDLSRQGIQAAGGDRYQQARLAMEQQRGLSDTRGLTAGARQGASDQLSAAQQVALNQIESGVRNELTQLKQQGIQDEFLAQEYASRKVEQFKQTDPQWGKLEILSNKYNGALQLGDKEGAQAALNELLTLQGNLLGTEVTDVLGSSTLTVSQKRDDLIQRMSSNPQLSEKIWTWVGAFGAIIGGSFLMGAGFFLAPMGIGIPMAAVGAGLLVYGGHLSKVASDKNMPMEKKVAQVDKILAEQRAEWIEMKYPPADVDKAIAEYRAKLIPAFQ